MNRDHWAWLAIVAFVAGIALGGAFEHYRSVEYHLNLKEAGKALEEERERADFWRGRSIFWRERVMDSVAKMDSAYTIAVAYQRERMMASRPGVLIRAMKVGSYVPVDFPGTAEGLRAAREYAGVSR